MELSKAGTDFSTTGTPEATVTLVKLEAPFKGTDRGRDTPLNPISSFTHKREPEKLDFSSMADRKTSKVSM